MLRLKTKIINIESGGILISVLTEKDATSLGVHSSERIRISKGVKRAIAIVDIAEKYSIIQEGEIGLFFDLASQLDILEGDEVNVEIEKSPNSVLLIKKKLKKETLKEKEINEIIEDLVANRLTEIEIACFVTACYINGMTLEESVYLTKAIVRNGSQIDINKKPIVDKHCIGGVPGNRTTLIIVPILAAANLYIPKTSTRSITSPAGTSDTMEVLAPVAHSKESIRRIVEKYHGCMVWGGTLDLASADDRLIKIEKPLNLDPEGILLASIIAKKASVNATHVLIDIPIGIEAKIKNRKKALDLQRKFIKLGKKLGMKVRVIITDGSQPIGKGIGPALEARDVLLVLQNRGPKDLRNKSLSMAADIMSMVGIKNAYQKAEEILVSGKAEKKMREIIRAQGGNPNIHPDEITVGPFHYEVSAARTGMIKEISNSIITRVSKIAGAPIDKGAGIYLNVKVKDHVTKGDILFTIYSENKDKLRYAIEVFKENNPVKMR